MPQNSITTVTPFLTVYNGKNAVDFYKSAWGAVVETRFNMPEDKLNCLLKIEGAAFWVGDEEPQFGNVSPGPTANNPVRIVLQTLNADELFENALHFGATAICPMTTEEDWRIGKLKDPFGHIWEIGYPL